MKDSTVKAILKYKNHPRIVTIRHQRNNKATFSFNEFGIKEVEHLNLNQDVP